VALTLQLLSVLQYLQSLRPPVVHRDIKPANILVDRDDGDRVSLVDFGAVAAANPAATMGSTIIGTYGYGRLKGTPLARETAASETDATDIDESLLACTRETRSSALSIATGRLLSGPTHIFSQVTCIGIRLAVADDGVAYAYKQSCPLALLALRKAGGSLLAQLRALVQAIAVV